MDALYHKPDGVARIAFMSPSYVEGSLSFTCLIAARADVGISYTPLLSCLVNLRLVTCRVGSQVEACKGVRSDNGRHLQWTPNL